MNPKCSVCGSAMIFEQTREGNWEERRWRCAKDCRGSERVLVFHNPRKLDVIPDYPKLSPHSAYKAPQDRNPLRRRHWYCSVCQNEIFGNSQYCESCLNEFSLRYNKPLRRVHNERKHREMVNPKTVSA